MIDTHQPRPGQTALKGLGDRERDSHQIYFSGYEVHALDRKKKEVWTQPFIWCEFSLYKYIYEYIIYACCCLLAESETENTQHQSVLNPNYPWYSLISVVMISVSLSLVYVITGCGDQAGSVAMCPDNVCCDQDMMSRDQLTRCRCYTPSAMSQTNKHVGLKYGLLPFYSFSCDNLVSTLTICLTCASPLCVRELLMVLISDIVSLLLPIIRPNHWVSLRSFIPPCNQRQFVTMPNEKIPVSSGSYLPITRCLTAACLPCIMARMTHSGASFPHSRF